MKLAIGVKDNDYSYISQFIGFLNEIIAAIGNLLNLLKGFTAKDEEAAETEGE